MVSEEEEVGAGLSTVGELYLASADQNCFLLASITNKPNLVSCLLTVD